MQLRIETPENSNADDSSSSSEGSIVPPGAKISSETFGPYKDFIQYCKITEYNIYIVLATSIAVTQLKHS